MGDFFDSILANSGSYGYDEFGMPGISSSSFDYSIPNAGFTSSDFSGFGLGGNNWDYTTPSFDNYTSASAPGVDLGNWGDALLSGYEFQGTPGGVAPTENAPWYSQLGSWALGNPDKAVGLGMGIFNGIGGMMAARQSNKYAKKASKRNDKLAAMEQKQWERMQRNQAINDQYNYSIDKTSPASVEYTPYQGNYASYGETGNPNMQVRVTPGETTRTQLYAQGGLANYALDGATGGQDDAIPALLSDGEYVFDADTVAALGDGNTQKGASALDQMRIEIRKHKRAAPVDKIPPKAKKATAYLKNGKQRKVGT